MAEVFLARQRCLQVFAAGIVLWELCTGRRLYGGKCDLASMVAIVREPAPLASSVVPDLPPELDEILQRALARSQSERYASALDMRNDLEALVQSRGWPSNALAVARELKALFPPVELFDDGPTVASPPNAEMPVVVEQPEALPPALVAGAPSVPTIDPALHSFFEMEPLDHSNADAGMSQGSDTVQIYDDWSGESVSISVSQPIVHSRRWRWALTAALVCFALCGLSLAVVRYFHRDLARPDFSNKAYTPSACSAGTSARRRSRHDRREVVHEPVFLELLCGAVADRRKPAGVLERYA